MMHESHNRLRLMNIATKRDYCCMFNYFKLQCVCAFQFIFNGAYIPLFLFVDQTPTHSYIFQKQKLLLQWRIPA
ncbi:hypothetical protein QVD17_32338 [Tagetes erecta]|uniref:Uncharacterized protein n=1 Tax=Tagetes erecta TaxID=13708 RepID=A0AAD8K9G2_TARER|nr:hypothetical protein QVD17_32338 [Tagetes erecta]